MGPKREKVVKRIALIVIVGALAACSKPADDNPAAPAAAEKTASDDSIAGSYRVVRSDGSSYTSVINADGTYSEVENGTTRESGRWQAEGERTCYDPDGPAGRVCYSFSEPTQPAEEGTFLAKSEKNGEVFTVRKIEE